MANKTHFSPASEKGHFNGLVVEGKYLRQSLLYKQILPRTPSRPKTSIISVNPVILSNFSSCLCAFLWLKNPFNPWLIKDLRSTKVYVRKNKLYMQNKANFPKSQMNVTDLPTMNYEQMDTWSRGKTKPKQSQFKPNTKPIQTQYKPKTKPIQTQNKANLSRRSLWRRRIKPNL